VITLPDQPAVSGDRSKRLRTLAAQTRNHPPAHLAALIRDELHVDLSARYGGLSLPHPFGKASGQLSTTIPQVEADVAAGIAFVVLKTVIAEDASGERSMEAWTVRETRMKVEKRTSAAGREGWTVSWKGRGWPGKLAEYLEFFQRSLAIGLGSQVPIIPSVKYHLPLAGERFKEDEYHHTTRALLDVWKTTLGAQPMVLEKDFSPTLAGDDRSRQREAILRWLTEVPRLIDSAAPGEIRIAVKLMNALFDDDFQVQMVRAALHARPRPALVLFNRLFDAERKLAFGGFDLSDRNLRVLDRVRQTPFSATGNICSGRMMVEYGLRGAENGQLHSFFQLPLSEYLATGGSRTTRALHTLLLHPERGLVIWLWHLNEQGLLPEREGAIHFLDVAKRE
jgi:hypothetical protein